VLELGRRLNEIFLRFSPTSLYEYSSCTAECEFSAGVTLTLQNHILLGPRQRQAAPFFVRHVHVCGRQIVLGCLEWGNLSLTAIHQHVASRVRLTCYVPYTIWSHFSQSNRSRRPLCRRLHRNDAKWSEISIVGWHLPENCMDYEAPFPHNLWASRSGSPQLTTNVCEAFHLHYRNTFTILTPTSVFYLR
jgi:hypothetical protein